MYKYGIFISYKHDNNYGQWVEKVFLPIVLDHIISEWGQEGVGITFFDKKNLKEGNIVPDSLRLALAHSRVMIAVLSGPYFCDSHYCPFEFSAIYNRQTKLNFSLSNEGKGLLFPIVFTKPDSESNKEKTNLVDKCPKIHNMVENLVPLKLDAKSYLNTSEGFKQTSAYDELKWKIKNWVDDSIIPSLLVAPSWQEQWLSEEWFEQPFTNFKGICSQDCKKLFINAPTL